MGIAVCPVHTQLSNLFVCIKLKSCGILMNPQWLTYKQVVYLLWCALDWIIPLPAACCSGVCVIGLVIIFSNIMFWSVYHLPSWFVTGSLFICTSLSCCTFCTQSTTYQMTLNYPVKTRSLLHCDACSPWRCIMYSLWVFLCVSLSNGLTEWQPGVTHVHGQIRRKSHAYKCNVGVKPTRVKFEVCHS